MTITYAISAIAAGLIIGAAFYIGDILCLLGRHRWALNPETGWQKCQRKGCHSSRVEVLLTRPRGACGIRGCPNMRPHSHVADLVRRLRGS